MRHWLWKQYRITLEQYNEMYMAQGGRCLICTRLPEECGTKYLHVDHDHDCGTIRGLLCKACNCVLGLARDNPDWLRAAAKYLARFDVHDVIPWIYSGDDEARTDALLRNGPHAFDTSDKAERGVAGKRKQSTIKIVA